MRTLPSASVISSSEMFDSETRSIKVLSLRRSMRSPTFVVLGRVQWPSTVFFDDPAAPGVGSPSIADRRRTWQLLPDQAPTRPDSENRPARRAALYAV